MTDVNLREPSSDFLTSGAGVGRREGVFGGSY